MSEPFSTFRDDALGNMDTVDLLAALRAGTVSADEIQQAALERTELANGPLNAVVCMVEHVERFDGPFAGVPTFVKDNEDIVGLPTRHGSRTTSPEPLSAPTPFVRDYQQLGFSVLGKSTMPEFGLTATTETLAYGPTRNPRNPDHSTGGSSGGSAALVAAGVVTMSHANDGGGSIRIPASCCGLVGLKPTRGRFASRPEMEKLPVAITAQGVVTRSVRDTALFFSEMEKFRNEVPPVGLVTGPGEERLRIALVEDAVAGLPVNPEVTNVVRDAAAKCEELGHNVELIPFPFNDQFGTDFLRYWAALAFTVKVSGKQAFGPSFNKNELEPFALELAGLFKDVALTVPASLRRLRRFEVDYATAFADFDVILSPVTSHPSPPIGYLGADTDPHEHLVRLLRYASFTAIHNVSGAPAISMPFGRSEIGLPIGVQAWAPFGEERRLLELAFELEQFGWK